MNRSIFAIFFVLCGTTSLIRAQADKGYDVISYNATVKLDRQTDSIFGMVTMTARSTADINDILQQAKYLSVDSIFVNGTRTSKAIIDTLSGSYIVHSTSIIPSSIFQVLTYYHGKGVQEQSGSFHWGGVTDSDTMMFAMGVGFYAPYTGCTRHWLPCYDLPEDKPDSVDLT